MESISNAIPIRRYVALDVHKHYVMVGGMDEQSNLVLRIRKVEMPCFREWAQRNLQMGDAEVLEATSNTWEVHDIVAPLVSRTVVANPFEVRQIAEARVKTDKHDVMRLLRLLIANIVPEVWVPPKHVSDLLPLRLNKQITMTKNRLHSVLRRYNLMAPEGELFAEKNQGWWQTQVFSPLLTIKVEHNLVLLRQLEGHREAIDRELARLSNTEPWAAQMVYLMQLPGFGIILGMTVLSAIGDVFRFESHKQLVGYAGLGAGVHDSGEKHQGKGITKRGRKELRCLPWWARPGGDSGSGLASSEEQPILEGTV